jgi:uncharacterized lipoprotein YmbA
MHRRDLPRLAAGLVLAGLAACAGPTRPTSFYTLAGPAPAPVGTARKPRGGLVVGLGPVTLPPYLDRPDIVTRASDNEMRLADFHKWAEPVEPMLTRLLAEDLYALLDARDVIPLPQRREVAFDRVVEVDVVRFDADQAGQVVLDARWRIYAGDGERLLTSGRSVLAEAGAPVPDYDAIVAAMSRAVGRLGEEIAVAVSGNTKTSAPRRTSGKSTSS